MFLLACTSDECSYNRSSLQLTAQQQPIPAVQQTRVDALVGSRRRVQLVDGASVVVHFGLCHEHAAAPEGVIDGDDAADPQQLQTGLVVGRVAPLVGVNEGEVEGPRLAGRYQRLGREGMTQVWL